MTNDTERMRIDSNGFAGIGTSTPQARLDVNGPQIIRGDGSGYILFAPKLGTSVFGANFDRFDIRVDAVSQETWIGNFNGGTGQARALLLYAANSERMRLDTNGNVLVGTTSNQTGAKVNAAGGVGISNTATNRFATVEYGSGASGTFTTITTSFTVDSTVSSVIIEVLMTGFSSVYLDHVAARYSGSAAVVMRNNASAGTTVASLAVNGAGTTYTLTITTSVTHPVVKVKATVGGLGGITTLPTITFA
jgi:hypothetical protein